MFALPRLIAVAVVALFLGDEAAADDLEIAIGKALFDRNWVSAPSSTQATDGLGPLFNARSCAACHPAGGAGRTDNALVVRLGRSADDGMMLSDESYGWQLQTRAIQGHAGEAHVVAPSDVKPLSILDLSYGPLGDDTKLSARFAPELHGIGLLERVPTAEILANADPHDLDRDGISGRANFVTRDDGTVRLGRFGWKASRPGIEEQTAAAFFTDIGLSNPLHPPGAGDCTTAQPLCLAAPDGNSEIADGFEISQAMLDSIVSFLRNLPPRATPLGNARGLALFEETGCADCHRVVLAVDIGGEFKSVNAYTDLLLHDMGQELADQLAEGQASGSEWRTAPLWGLSVRAETKTEAARLLHDGRAPSIEAAVLHHAGESAAARRKFESLDREAQQQLIEFLRSL